MHFSENDIFCGQGTGAGASIEVASPGKRDGRG